MLRSPLLGEDQSVGHPSVPPGEGHLRLKKDGPMKEGEQKAERKGVGKEERLREAERNRKTEMERDGERRGERHRLRQRMTGAHREAKRN